MFVHHVAMLDVPMTVALDQLLVEHQSGRLQEPAARALRAANASLGTTQLDVPPVAAVMVMMADPRWRGRAVCVPIRWSCAPDLHIALDADVMFRPRDEQRTQAELRAVLRPHGEPTTVVTAQEAAHVGLMLLSALLPAAGQSVRSIAHTSRPPSTER